MNLFEKGYQGTELSPFAKELVEQLRSYLLTVMHLRISIGVGTVCASVEELNRSWKVAEEALEYRFITGKDSVIFGHLQEMQRIRTGQF